MPMTSFKILFSPFHVWTRSFASRCWTSLQPYSTSNWIRILEHVPSQRELLELKREVSSILRSSRSDPLVRFRSSEIQLTSPSWSNLILSTLTEYVDFFLILRLSPSQVPVIKRCDIDNEMIKFAMRCRTYLWVIYAHIIVNCWAHNLLTVSLTAVHLSAQGDARVISK